VLCGDASAEYNRTNQPVNLPLVIQATQNPTERLAIAGRLDGGHCTMLSHKQLSYLRAVVVANGEAVPLPCFRLSTEYRSE
jgi:hypothetical protein